MPSQVVAPMHMVCDGVYIVDFILFFSLTLIMTPSLYHVNHVFLLVFSSFGPCCFGLLRLCIQPMSWWGLTSNMMCNLSCGKYVGWYIMLISTNMVGVWPYYKFSWLGKHLGPLNPLINCLIHTTIYVSSFISGVEMYKL